MICVRIVSPITPYDCSNRLKTKLMNERRTQCPASLGVNVLLNARLVYGKVDITRMLNCNASRKLSKERIGSEQKDGAPSPLAEPRMLRSSVAPRILLHASLIVLLPLVLSFMLSEH